MKLSPPKEIRLFSLLINLAEGGDFPGTQDVLVDGKKQYLIVKSAKAYGF